MRRALVVILALAAAVALSAPFSIASAETASDATVKPARWHGFERVDFELDKRKCTLVLPAKAASGKPWIWRMEFFGHEPQVDLALLNRGFHLAYIDLQNMYGAPAALDRMDQFYAHLATRRGLAAKTVLEGFSRGGLYSLNWAARNPGKVACIYNDAPVCDFLSWPAGRGRSKRSASDWAALLEAYDVSETAAMNSPLNPINNLAPLARARIHLLHVCGADDDIVPLEENTALLADRYRRLGGAIEVIVKQGVGHHPHSLQDPSRIVAFILKHTTSGAR